MAKRTKKPGRGKRKGKKRPASEKQAPKSRKKKRPKGRKRPKKVLKPSFEQTEGPPPGFDITPHALTQEQAYATIAARLEDAKGRLPDALSGRTIMHSYVDGSVDGELYVKIPDDTSSGDVEWDLYDAFGALTVGRRYWISVGARYIIEADDEIYRRFRGMNQVQTNFQRANQANIVEEHLLLRKKLLPGMERHYKREAHSLFIRIHWNPENVQPKR